MKVFNYFFYILGFLLELIIKIWWFEKIIFQRPGEFGSFFFSHEKSFVCIGQNHFFFRSKFGENSPEKETLGHFSGTFRLQWNLFFQIVATVATRVASRQTCDDNLPQKTNFLKWVKFLATCFRVKKGDFANFLKISVAFWQNSIPKIKAAQSYYISNMSLFAGSTKVLLVSLFPACPFS